MMDGITILSTTEKVLNRAPGWSWVAFGILVFGIACIVVGVYLDVLPLFCLGCCCFVFCIHIFLRAKADPPTTVYKVTIDDNVSLQDFYNYYDILEIDGKIYSIIEKEAD